MRYHL